MISVVGGVYWERIARENWDEFLGSAGRGAETIVNLGGAAELHTYLDERARVSLANRNRLNRYAVRATIVVRVATFGYIHGLAPPIVGEPSDDHLPLEVTADNIVVYGMIAGGARIKARYAVYDAQNTKDPQPFSANGSTADHLALVLNRHEAATILGVDVKTAPVELARRLASHENAEVVVLKIGPTGALVVHGDDVAFVPPYRTSRVFKVGSGDVFVAAFAHGWIELKLPPSQAADRASRATAFYVEHRRMPTDAELTEFSPSAVVVSDSAHQREGGGAAALKVYLAGPFFTLGQYWIIEEAKAALASMGLEVLSPYHLVGPGEADQVVAKDLEYLDEADLVLAIGDGMDAGTVFEVGYAHAKGKPVVFYAENEIGEDLKMFQGTGCRMTTDFVSAIYQTVWEGLAL
jgi:nucleoside 2-deoxyribosyltransferase